jgi:hypothetical protein
VSAPSWNERYPPTPFLMHTNVYAHVGGRCPPSLVDIMGLALINDYGADGVRAFDASLAHIGALLCPHPIVPQALDTTNGVSLFERIQPLGRGLHVARTVSVPIDVSLAHIGAALCPPCLE